LTQDYLTIDASAVEDVKLALKVANKHISATLGKADDTLVLNAGAAASATYSNLNIDFGDGKDKIVVEDNTTSATTVDATGSKFTNVETIELNNDNQNLTLIVDASVVSGKAIAVKETTTAKTSTIQIEGASTGAEANDTIDLTKISDKSNVDNWVIKGNAGDDTIKLGDDFKVANTPTIKIYGGEGNDYIVGSQYGELIFGGLGADTIKTGAGNDKVILDSPFAAADKITDFTSGTDKVYIDLKNDTANVVAASKFGTINTVDVKFATANALNAQLKVFIKAAAKKVNSANLVALNATMRAAANLTANKLFKGSAISFATNGNGAITKIVIKSNGAVATSITQISGGNNAKVTKTAVLFFYDTAGTGAGKLYMFGLKIKDGGADAGSKIDTIFKLTSKVIATITTNGGAHNIAATDVYIF